MAKMAYFKTVKTAHENFISKQEKEVYFVCNNKFYFGEVQ